jgi:hypothetical protein
VSDVTAESNEKPDAIVSVVEGASFGRTIAYGEVKPEAQAINHNPVTKDLERIGRLAKDAFLVVGKCSFDDLLSLCI